MATQELKTQLVFEAANAIRSCETLQTTLDKISKIDFSNIANGFREMTKVIETSSKKYAEVANKIQKQSETGDKKRIAILQEETNTRKALQQELLKTSEEARKATRQKAAAEKKAIEETAAAEKKAIEDTASKKQAALEKEKENLKELEYQTLKLREQENKALEGLQRKIFKLSDFDAVERKLLNITKYIDKIWGDDSASKAVHPFVNMLKELNEQTLKDVQSKQAGVQAQKYEEELRRLQNLFNRHRALMQNITDLYSANPKADIKKEQAELVELSREVGRLAVELGKTGQAATFFRQAFDLSKGRQEFKGLIEEIQKFRQAQNISNDEWKTLGARPKLPDNSKRQSQINKDAEIAEELMIAARKQKLSILRRLEVAKKPFDDLELQGIGLDFESRAKRINRRAPQMGADQDFSEFLKQVRAKNEELKKSIKELEKEKDATDALTASENQLKKETAARARELKKAADEAIRAQKEATQEQSRRERNLRTIEKLKQQVDIAETKVNERLEAQKPRPLSESEIKQFGYKLANAARDIDVLSGKEFFMSNADNFIQSIRAQNEALKRRLEEEARKAQSVTKQTSDTAMDVKARSNAERLQRQNREMLEKTEYQAWMRRLTIQDRLADENARPYTPDQLRKIREEFRRMGAIIDRIDPSRKASKIFGEFVREVKEITEARKAQQTAAAKANTEEQALNETIKIRIRLARLAAQAERQSVKEREQTQKRIREAQRNLESLDAAFGAKFKAGGFFKDNALTDKLNAMLEAANTVAKLTGDNTIASNMAAHVQRLTQQNAELRAQAEKNRQENKKTGADEQAARRQAAQNAKDAKAEEERLRRIAKLMGNVAEIQARIKERLGIGKLFSENEFVRVRNQLRKIGLELDRLTNKNVSGYISYILDNVRIKNTPSTVNNAASLSQQYDAARKRAETLAQNLAQTKSIADAIRFGNAMRDLRELTHQTDLANRLLGKTESYYQRITNLIERQMSWKFGGALVDSFLNLPNNILKSYRDIEQAMAGVQQVMPIIENHHSAFPNLAPLIRSAETSNLLEIAETFARSAQEVTEGAQLWGRGYGKPSNDPDEVRQSLEQLNQTLAEQGIAVDKITDETVEYINQAEAMATTNELVRQSAILATVDNFSMAESVKGLEAVLAAYGLRAKTAAEASLYAGRAVDIISKVAHTGQISAQDLVRGIEATGKAAEQAGISLEFLSAMLETGVRNTAKSGSDIGNAIKALTVGIYGDKGQAQLQNFGIETTYVDEKGLTHARAAQAIILDIARALQDGNKNAQKMLLAISGGRYQYSKISSILKDEAEILRMWSEAVDSAGFADKQLEVQLDTINAKLKQLQANVDDLYQTSVSEFAGIIKSGIDLISDGVKSLTQNFNALKLGASAFLAIFLGGKVVSIAASFVEMAKSVGAFQTALKASGYNGGFRGIFTAGIKGIPDEFSNRSRQRAIALTEALAQSERRLTVEEQRQIQTLSVATTQALRLIAVRSEEAGVTNQLTRSILANAEANAVNTASKTANAAASGAAATATLAEGAALRVASIGFGLVNDLLLIGVPLLLTYAAASDSATEKIDKLGSATQKYIENTKLEREETAQNIEQRQTQLELTDKAIETLIAATEALQKETKGTKEWEKANERAKIAEDILTKAFKKAAVERIKDSSDMRAAYEKEKSEFVKDTDEMQKKLDELVQKEGEAYTERIAQAESLIEIRQKDIESFGAWKDEQLEGLNWLEKGYLRFWQLAYNLLGGDELEQRGIKLRGWAANLKEWVKEQATGEGLFGFGLQAQVEEAKKERDEAKAAKAALDSSKLDEELYKSLGDEGVFSEEEDEDKSKKKKSDKVVEHYNTDIMRFIAAVSEQDKRIKTADLVALAGYIQGGDGETWSEIPSDAVNPFKVTQAVMDKYFPAGSLGNVGDNARALVEYMLDLDGSVEELFTKWFLEIGMAQDELQALEFSRRTLNQSEYLENGYENFPGIDYNKLKDRIAIYETSSGVTPIVLGDNGASLKDWAQSLPNSQMSDAVFDKIVNSAQSLGYSLDELRLALAVAVKESNGRQDVTSYVGAHGVFQLMPETAEYLKVNAYDIDENILGGLTYLQEQLESFKDWRVALAAYNAGPGNVEKYGGVPPYYETQKYVAEIMGMVGDNTPIGGSGEGQYWIKQHGGVSYEGAKPETMQAIDALGRWFYEQTGRPLVVTAVTNGTHAEGEFSHRKGFKADINDWGSGGAEGSITTDNGEKGYLVDALIKFGQSLGLGMNWEGDHVDVSAAGEQWEGQLAGTNFGGFKAAPSTAPPLPSERKLSDYWNINEHNKKQGISSIKLDEFSLDTEQKRWNEKRKEYEEQIAGITRQQNLLSSLGNLTGGVPDWKRIFGLNARQADIEADFIKTLVEYRETIKSLQEASEGVVNDFRQQHKQIDRYLEANNLKWEELTAAQQALFAQKFNDKDVENQIKLADNLKSEWEKTNKLVEEHKYKLFEIRLQMIGLGKATLTTPQDIKEFDLNETRLDYEASKIGATYENPDRRRAYIEQQIIVREEELKNLQRQKNRADANAQLLDANLQKWFDAESAVKNQLEARQNNGEDVTAELQAQEEVLKKIASARENLALNGTKEQLEYRLKIKETNNAINELKADLNPLERAFKNTLADGVMNMFDAILVKGNTFKDAWNNLWQSIASFALRQLLMIQLQSWSSKFGWGLFGKTEGGEVAEKKNGGAIPRFAVGGNTTGLIRGAGTGTSDSILTYLEHRGQFIRTSDGEFIIKKKSVDKLGLTFLNRLNENPELFALKEKTLAAYAGGGSLGEEMEPVMSDRTVDNLQSFSKVQAEKENHSVRQEKLLEGISLQLSTFTRPVNETTNMNINAVDSRSFVQLLEKHSDVIMGLMRKERGRRNAY